MLYHINQRPPKLQHLDFKRVTQSVKGIAMNSLITPPQTILLDILSTIRAVSAERCAALSVDQWSQLARMASQHRLEPMLYHQIKARGLEQYIPQEMASNWQISYRQAAINALTLHRLTHDLRRILGDANIPFLLLKGSWLAWNVYAHPALRPMRDIDILVRHADVITAFHLLQAAGFSQSDQHDIPLYILLKFNKHLPGLACPQSKRRVEVHGRLFSLDDEKICPEPLANFDALYEKRQLSGLGTEQLAYPSTTDSLLHIIVHAVDDHVFNNGPVVIIDIQHILQQGGINWPYFWANACEGGWTKASCLVFDMVEYYHGRQAIDWQGLTRGDTPVTVIEAASALSLQDVDSRSNFSLAVVLARGSKPMAKLTRVVRKLSPSRHVLADIGKVPANSRRAYLYYPVWFFHNLRKFYGGTSKAVSASSLVNPVVGWLSQIEPNRL